MSGAATGRRQRQVSLVLLAMVLVGVADGSAEASAAVSIEFLSEYSIPGGFSFEGTCVGGLSALRFDRARDRYFAISDSRSDARYYELQLEIAGGSAGDSDRPRIARITFERVIGLRTREGLPYTDGRVDPEGWVLFDEETAFISSEGVAEHGVPPFVDRIEVDSGEWLTTVPIPVAFRPQHRGETQIRGVRSNLGFESLTLSPDRQHLFVASESALAQDIRGLAEGVERFARLLHFETPAVPRLAGEFLYPLTPPAGNVVAHGLVELLALDDSGHLLALERTWGPELGMLIRLFEIRLDSLRQRADRSTLSPAARSLPILDKQLLLDFKELPILLDNFEGMSFGPRLADGSESLLILGDNDNTDCHPPQQLSDLRPTKFLLFRLRR